MKKFSIADLARIIKADPAKNDGLFDGVSIDSRTIKPGDCFFAIAGDNFDGHDYLADAFARGAACAVVKNNRSEKFNGHCLLKVHDTIKALGRFAADYRRQGNYKVIAITGSVGKTTTREITRYVLGKRYQVVASQKNFNNDVGLPLTLLTAQPQDEIIVAELGSNYPGEIANLTRIAGPDIALVTNVYPAHLAGFGDIETIVEEKLSISQGLKDEGVFVINGDIELLVNTCRSKGIKFTTFGRSNSCCFQAKNITHNDLGSRFTLDGTLVSLPLRGTGNVENALAAWSICSRLGVTIDDFADALKTLPAPPMRAELLQQGTLTILNDCYNANPASMKNAMEILAGLSGSRKSAGKSGRSVFICGDMAELGCQTEKLHAELGSLIAEAKVELLITVGNYAKIAAEIAKEKADYNLQIECFESTLSACNNLEKFIKDYDIVLVKGSRSARLELAVEKLSELFSIK